MGTMLIWDKREPDGEMVQNRNPECVEAQGKRLRLTRIAIMDGVDNQAAFCRLMQMETSAWNNAETGDNQLAIPNALKLCRKFGVTLDWIYREDMRMLPPNLVKRIGELQSNPFPKKTR